MNVLGIDTSRAKASVVVARQGEVLACLTQDKVASSSVAVLSLIESALSQSTITIDKIGFIALAQGPGSFTGLRVGFGTALGVGHATGLKVMGICSLDAMARSQAGWGGGYIVPVESSRRGEVFAALYRTEGGILKKLTSDMAIEPYRLAAMIDGSARFIGSGFLPYKDIFCTEISAEVEFVPAGLESFARELAEIALEKFEAEGLTASVTAPCYVSRSQAEINFGKRKN